MKWYCVLRKGGLGSAQGFPDISFGDGTFTKDCDRIGGGVDDGGGHSTGRAAAVDDEIDTTSELGHDVLGGVGFCVAGKVGGGNGHWTGLTEEVESNGVIGDAYADGGGLR